MVEMETSSDLQLPHKFSISVRKKIIFLVYTIIIAPILAWILLRFGYSLSGLSEIDTELFIVVFVVIVAILYPFFLTPYIKLTTQGISIRSLRRFPLVWNISWRDVDEFIIVRTFLPIGSSTILPYEKIGIGLSFKKDIPTDIISNQPSKLLKALYSPIKYFVGAQIILPDTTNLLDKSTYGMAPEDLVALLNNLRDKYGQNHPGASVGSENLNLV